MDFAVVEGCSNQAEVLKALLSSEGYRVEVFASGQACLAVLDSRRFDFFVIDRHLPDIAGDDVLRAIRKRIGRDVPVIMCSADPEEIAEKQDLGADDYLSKPIRYMTFMARVAALLRQAAGVSSALQLGALEVDLETRRVRLAGNEIVLTQREFDLAATLLRNIGRVLSREELLVSVWARDANVDTRTVDTHASRLRKKIGLAGESGLMLSSVYGQGYRLDTVAGN